MKFPANKTLLKICLALLLLSSFTQIKAQENIINRGLKIGDKVPATLITGISNYKTKKAYLSSFKGKLLILDFWATWCSPCRAMVPVMDSLQRAFGDKIVFLPIAYESNLVVAPVLAHIQKIHPFNLPCVTGDKILNTMFPHRILPHYVWIDGDGIVRAITEEDAVNGPNIRSFLEGKNNKLPEKEDFVIAYNKDQPLLIDGNGGNSSVMQYHSILTGYIKGLHSGMDLLHFIPADSVKGPRFLLRNSTLSMLFLLANYDKGWFIGPRLRILSADSGKIIPTHLSGQAEMQWLAKNGVCYELMVPPMLKDSAFAIIRDDLRRLYPQYAVNIEHVRTRCRVLVRTGTSNKLQSAGGKPTIDINPFGCDMKNCLLKVLIGRLEIQYMQNSPYPIVDETGYKGYADLSLHAQLSNVNDINKELKKYDLQFVDKDAWTDLLVVRDTGKAL